MPNLELRIPLSLLAAIVLAGSGCTHAVLFDDPAPLAYPERTPVRVGYHVTPETLNQVYSTRAWSAGIANKWVVYPGQVLDQYSRAYLSGAFVVFQPANGTTPSENDPPFVVSMEIPFYDLSGFRAHLTVKATVRNRDGEVVHTGERTRTGASGAGRVMLGGAFATKSMIRQSTDSAIRPALEEIVAEMRNAAAGWPVGDGAPPDEAPPADGDGSAGKAAPEQGDPAEEDPPGDE